jgi:hypothetical protein
LGMLHLREYHLVLLDLQSILFLFFYCLAYHFYFQFCIFVYTSVCILFSFCIFVYYFLSRLH